LGKFLTVLLELSERKIKYPFKTFDWVGKKKAGWVPCRVLERVKE
jgi:hypothetical protein